VYECPTIRLVPPPSLAGLDAAISRLSSFSWLILTSVNGVQFFFRRLHELGLDARALGACRVCAVGPKTAAAIREQGVIADLVPNDYKAEGVVAEFARIDMAGARILFPHVDKAREVIPAALAEMGAEVEAPVAYCNVLPDSLPDDVLQALEERRVDCITFTSSSTVENLAAMLGESRFLRTLDGMTVASIGPITSKTCRDLGLPVAIEPASYTLAALTDAIVDYYSAAGA
jgi:uroporphyrinogen III methyltransferase/synthase